MASQITSISVCSTICSGTYGRKHQSLVLLAFVRGILQWPVESPDKGPVTQEMFRFDDVIMVSHSRKADFSLFDSVTPPTSHTHTHTHTQPLFKTEHCNDSNFLHSWWHKGLSGWLVLSMQHFKIHVYHNGDSVTQSSLGHIDLKPFFKM